MRRLLTSAVMLDRGGYALVLKQASFCVQFSCVSLSPLHPLRRFGEAKLIFIKSGAFAQLVMRVFNQGLVDVLLNLTGFNGEFSRNSKKLLELMSGPK